MGLLKHLLFWPVTGPSFLTRFSLEKVDGAVRSELTDDGAVKRELMELQMALELGDIDEAEYDRREAELMRRLRDVRRWRERYGMPTSGGLVRVAEPRPAAGDGEPDAPEPEGGPAAGEQADIDIVLGFDES